MSTASWPASALILRSGIGAMKPFFISSKSRVSANGRPWDDFFRAAMVWEDGDFDSDGDLDLFISNGLWAKFGQSCELYRNEGGPNHWIEIKLKGTVSNRSAIGTKVWAKARIRGGGTTQMRELQMSGGADSSAGQRIHFGLGDATTIDTLRIEWPSGLVQEMHDVAADQFLTTVEEGG